MTINIFENCLSHEKKKQKPVNAFDRYYHNDYDY